MDRLDQWQIIVPARLASSRLPGKPLADLAGKPLVARTVENLRPLVDAGAEVMVAADDEKIIAACRAHNIAAIMTADFSTGTDRCHAAAQKTNRPWILNVQVDEPFLAAADLAGLAAALPTRKDDIGTLVYPDDTVASFRDPNTVKAVWTTERRALYFSRAPIPWLRDDPERPQNVGHHIGVYAYHRDTLDRFCSLPPGTLESIEKLEQLRALENNMTIYVHAATKPSIGIDTSEDLANARLRY